MSDSSPNSNVSGRPTLCRNCGAIVGAGAANCAVCGASTTAPQLIEQRNSIHDNDTLRFARAVLDRPYKFTITFLIANLFVYLLMWDSSGLSNLFLTQGFPNEILIAYGAKVNQLVARDHEWWRLVTPMFVHVNLIHLLVNMYSLWMIGPYVEKLYGSAKFVVFWVVTGIGGVVASYLTVQPSLATNTFARFIFKAFDEPSAGASGALFGLVGVLFVFGIKYRNELPEGFKRAFGTGLLPIIVLNLFIGFIGSRSIDNAAHLGGLFSGAALALVVQYRRPGETQGNAIVWRVLQVAMLALVALSFFKVTQHFNAPRLQHQLTQAEIFDAYANVMNKAQFSAAAAIYQHDYSEMNASLQMIDTTMSPDPKGEELKQRIRALLAKAAAQPSPSPDGPKQTTPDPKLVQEYMALRKDYDAWLKTAAPKTDQ
ncbi:MAG TPA: rhomboid family intramembrane serine protease [Pyrinomonadaceae bacterium]